MNTNKTSNLLTLYIQIWIYQLIGITIFSLARIFHLFSLSSIENLSKHLDSLPLFLWNSWRFDIQAITYISLPAILAALVVSFIGKNAVNKYIGVIRVYYSVLLSIVTLIVTAEFFYFENFTSRYNIVFFDFFDEGPMSLLLTMWQDYPLVKILLSVIAFGVLIYVSGKYISRIKVNILCNPIYIVLIAIIGMTFILMRGSVTRYTLQVEAFMVSNDEKINQSVPNSFYLLKKAYKERKNSFKIYSDEYLLSNAGFNNIHEAILNAGLPLCDANSNIEKLENAIFGTAPGNGKCSLKSPNVLLILSESWSSIITEMDKGDSLDILGSLRKHLKEDIMFKNFQSVRNGTIYSIEMVTLTMPYIHFFNSRYRFKNFQTSIAHPFKEDGYNTAFITGIDPTWENILEGLSYQDFDTIIGRQDILHEIKGSSTNAIGVYDEFLMQYLFERMNNNKETPQFTVVLTTTNHPPFTYPDNMELPPITDAWYESDKLIGERDVLTKYGLGAQYANKSIGDFLTKFKASELADNTIVIITGDHNTRSIFNYNGDLSRLQYSVPLYIYLPAALAMDDNQKEVIKERYGSHYDILSTIAPLSLNKGTKYLNVGNNLLDTTKNESQFFSYNEEQLLATQNCNTDSLMGVMRSRELIMKLYYQNLFREFQKDKKVAN